MIEDLSLILMLTRCTLLIAGVCALAQWAARQPDAQSELVGRLTLQENKRAEEQLGIRHP